MLSATSFNWISAILLAYFVGRLLFFALNVSSFVPPDEVTHAGICRAFSKAWLFPDNSPATYEFGLVTNIPWLYYWGMGKLLHLNFLGLPDLLFLRLLNIPLAVGTVLYARRTLQLAGGDRLARLLLLALITNTAMFSLLSASVSYDNLANLLAAMAIYYLFAFFGSRESRFLTASLLCQLAGCLVKVTFLPLLAALGLLLLVFEARNLRAFPAAARRYLRGRGARLALLLVTIAAVLNLQLYGGNYLRYGTLNPPMRDVVSSTAAMDNRLEARSAIFNQFREEKISYLQALMMAGQITHPGDKADTFYLLMNYQKMRQDPKLWLGPLGYAKTWFGIMTATTFGIKGHLGMFKPPRYLLPLYLAMLLALFGFLLRWRPRRSGWIPPALASIPLFYAALLVYEVNYPAYLNYGEPSLTVYGRYLFLVIVPCYALFCRYLLELFRPQAARVAVAAAVALLFIGYDFPWFLAHVTPQWLSRLPG